LYWFLLHQVTNTHVGGAVFDFVSFAYRSTADSGPSSRLSSSSRSSWPDWPGVGEQFRDSMALRSGPHLTTLSARVTGAHIFFLVHFGPAKSKFVLGFSWTSPLAGDFTQLSCRTRPAVPAGAQDARLIAGRAAGKRGPSASGDDQRP
jgi:hypothetical protein